MLCVILFLSYASVLSFVYSSQDQSINKHDLNVTSVSVKYARFGILSGCDFLGNSFGLDVRLPLHTLRPEYHRTGSSLASW